ncbi:hypothetical protein B6U84_00230 [Candidatus Bathyarchaeota archaeon ex4484_40]|nr:MAG: hypothetical protein B6U84_00230 [Candidatus Bathyarchaeota archaeon ex4484_40]
MNVGWAYSPLGNGFWESQLAFPRWHLLFLKEKEGEVVVLGKRRSWVRRKAQIPFWALMLLLVAAVATPVAALVIYNLQPERFKTATSSSTASSQGLEDHTELS